MICYAYTRGMLEPQDPTTKGMLECTYVHASSITLLHMVGCSYTTASGSVTSTVPAAVLTGSSKRVGLPPPTSSSRRASVRRGMSGATSSPKSGRVGAGAGAGGLGLLLGEGREGGCSSSLSPPEWLETLMPSSAERNCVCVCLCVWASV